MKKYLAIFLLIHIVLASYSKEYSFNLATLKKGDKVEKDVWIVNSTTKPISIISAETGCVCTKASFSKDMIHVGDSSLVRITYSAKDPGVFYKIVNIKTSEPTCDSKVAIRGKVIQ